MSQRYYNLRSVPDHQFNWDYKLEPPSQERYQGLCDFVDDLTLPELIRECEWRDYQFEQDDDGKDIIPERAELEIFLLDALRNE